MDISVKKYANLKMNVLEMDPKVVDKNVMLKKCVIIYVKKYVIQINLVLKNLVKSKLGLFVLVVTETHLQNAELLMN